MEERVGAYIIDSEGNLIPDLNDEAMAARVRAENLQPLQPEISNKMEVNKDA